MVRIFFIFFVSFYLFFSTNIKAQNKNEINLLEETINEKIKFPRDFFHKILEGKVVIDNQNHKPENSIKNKDFLHSFYEMEVSGISLVESEIHAAINPFDSNNIIISPIRQKPGDQIQVIDCPVYFTKDFGKTWNESEFSAKPSRDNVFLAGGGDPVLAFDAEGKAYHTWINLYFTRIGNNYDSVFADMYWAKSNDGGEEWIRSANDRVGRGLGKYTLNSTYGLNKMLDKQWIAVDRSNSPFKNNLYVVLTEITAGTTNNSRIKLFKKLADADTFQIESVQINKYTYNLVQFSSIDVDHKGTIHITFYGNNGSVNSLFYSNSTDGGNTFSPEIKITDFTFAGSRIILGNQNDRVVGMSQQRFYPCPILAVDKSEKSPNAGNIYLVWTANGINSVKGDGMDIYFTSSSDNGQSWSSPSIINDDEKGKKVSQYYPSITVNKRGVVIISWYDRRHDSTDNKAHYYMTASFDGGKTFLPNYRITGLETNFSRVGIKNNNFGIGEYNQVLASDYYAIPVWADGRTNDGNLNIYTAFIPLDESLLSVERVANIYNTVTLEEIFPNPAKNRISVKVIGGLDKSAEVQILNYQGKIIQKFDNIIQQKNEEVLEFSLDKFTSGIYFFKLTDKNNYIVKKFIIMN